MAKNKIDNTSLALDKDFTIDQLLPKELVDHYMIRKPIGVRVHKQDCRITHVLPESILIGKAFLGDCIVGIDDKVITSGDELHTKLKEKTENIHLSLKRNMFSWCFHIRTTVEKIQIDRDVERITPNPVNHYFVLIRLRPTPEMQIIDLGLFVKYNNRDRLEVDYVTPNSLASIHLKAGDVIREVNSQQICSKSMLRYHIANSIASSGVFTLLVESPIRDTVRDHIDLADDVVQIADKAAEEFKKLGKGYVPQPPRKANPKRNIKLKEEKTEYPIVSDIDPSKLRPCKNAS
ncbi:hypothetical protein GCK72_014964 [Caenorhabditis remanei]|uniref:PDZ domain-containing protein n=1 Tax=Caenorhabditis remanei TaxID=31234 RepID=E3NT62_CAERE|nr:hypothetical protein GCK72_014964 [Caenorhabditis remanei]EFO91668.1 hypothetical protein CRE_15144 [Caenorhabditis remanei]KAF1758506.1 hypothetical protein GCK72_014964 [Caenorhabditis remanei]